MKRKKANIERSTSNVQRRTEAKKEERSCRGCGCTENRACAGGCSWVDGDLCSSCMFTLRPMSAEEVLVMTMALDRFLGDELIIPKGLTDGYLNSAKARIVGNRFREILQPLANIAATME